MSSRKFCLDLFLSIHTILRPSVSDDNSGALSRDTSLKNDMFENCEGDAVLRPVVEMIENGFPCE